jgi:hypothetical protein
MNTQTRFGIKRIFTGWAIFSGGLLLVPWLHTFADRTPHRMLLPLMFFAWIALGVCVWDGCKSMALWKRIVFISVQAAVALIASILLVLHFLYHSS